MYVWVSLERKANWNINTRLMQAIYGRYLGKSIMSRLQMFICKCTCAYMCIKYVCLYTFFEGLTSGKYQIRYVPNYRYINHYIFFNMYNKNQKSTAILIKILR